MDHVDALCWQNSESFGRVSSLAKSAYYIRPVRLSKCVGAVPTGRISVKFDVRDVYENLSRKTKIWL